MVGVSASIHLPCSLFPTKLRLAHGFHFNLNKTKPDNGFGGPLHLGVMLLSLLLYWARDTPDSWPWSWLLPRPGMLFLQTSTHHSSSSFTSLLQCWPHRSYFPVHLLWVSSSYPHTHSPNPCPTSSSSLQLPSHIRHISCFHLSFVLPFAPNLGMQVVWWQEFLSVWLLLYLQGWKQCLEHNICSITNW